MFSFKCILVGEKCTRKQLKKIYKKMTTLFLVSINKIIELKLISVSIFFWTQWKHSIILNHTFFYHYFKWTTKYVRSSSFYYCSIKSNCSYLAAEPASHEQQNSSSVHLCFGNHGAAETCCNSNGLYVKKSFEW